MSHGCLVIPFDLILRIVKDFLSEESNCLNDFESEKSEIAIRGFYLYPPMKRWRCWTGLAGFSEMSESCSKN